MSVLFLAALLLQVVATAPPLSASAVHLSPPSRIVEIDSGKLKGDPTRLAWSPDGKQLYLLTQQRDRFGNTSNRHYLIGLEGGQPQSVDHEPDWAGRYWAWKAYPSAPGAPSFKIEIESRREQVRATAAPRGGDLARGDPGGAGASSGAGAGSSTDEAVMAAQQSQGVVTMTMKLRGEVIGEWVNQPMAPGRTFGWAPAPIGLIAFTDKDGQLLLLDQQGAKQAIEGTRDVILPAWSDDGTKLAYLRQTGKKKFEVTLLDVSRN